jgi:asparagine synthase (glutamine-hydrolysing)
MTIAGAVYPNEIPEESATRRMLSHSPQIMQVWQNGRIELGGASQQPRPFIPNSGIVVLIDGLIVNQEEINQEIQKQNPALTHESIEESIASLYFLRQEQAFTYLNGNFALALYDEKKQELLLVRDRLGEKGLYWILKNNLFLFANTLKSLLLSRLVSQTPDLEALSFYISFGYIPQEKSPIQNVFKLQPGHYLKVTKEKNLLIRPYWAYNAGLIHKNREIGPEDFSSMGAKVFRRRVSSTHPPLCYVQSEEEKSALQKEAGIPLKFISPDVPLSAQDVLDDLFSMVCQLEEPVADISLPNFWQTCKELKAQGETELFFSTGSVPHLIDEIYPPRIFLFKPLSVVERYLKEKMLIPLFYQFRPRSAYKMLRSIRTHPWHLAFLQQTALFDKKEFYDLHSQLLKPIDDEIFLHRFPALKRLGPTMSSLLYLYHKIKLPPSILLPQERFCSHFGMIKKAPYLDKEMVELFASVPDHGTRFNYEQLFTRTSSRIATLPPWTMGITIKKLMEKLSKSVLVEAGLFSRLWLSEQMKNFNRHPHLFFQELWGLLVLEVWFRLYIEGNIGDLK